MDIHVCMAESLYCSPETITTLKEKYMHPNFHNSIICNSQDVETT